MRTKLPRLSIAALLLAALLPAGCKKEGVRIYDAPKSDTVAPAGAVNAAAAPAAATGTIVWQKADHWEELPPTAFRKGNYRVTTADGGAVEITVSSFPGQVGGLLANVNRWLGQAGLPPVSQQELQELVTIRDLGPTQCTLVDLNANAEAADATRIYAAIIEHGGQSWFFKITGPKDGVGAEIGPLNAMLDGLRFESGGTAAAAASPASAAGSAAASSDNIAFVAPSDWTESEGSTVRIASYSIAKEGLPAADFSLTSFPGDAGGVVANVNRWRQQIGLPRWSDDQVMREAEKLENEAGLSFLVFDLRPDPSNTDDRGGERIFAAILEHGGQSWFFKLRGDVFLLETQRAKFRSLLQSVTFGPAEPAGAIK